MVESQKNGDPMDEVKLPWEFMILSFVGLVVIFLLYFKLWSWILGG